MQQPSKKRLAHYKEVFGLTATQMRTVAEVYNPKVFTTKATKHRLIPGKAFDLVLGDNLLSAGARRSVMNYLQHDRPRLVVVSPPCRPFSQLQNLSLDSRYKNPVRMQEYMKKLSEGKRLLQFACQVCQLCSSLGLTFLFEHPWAAKSWQEKCLRRVKKLDGVCLVRGDQCQFGLRDQRGQPLRKATGFMTNCQALADRLARRCRQDHEHGHIIGALDGYPKSKDAQYYPDGLANAALKEYARLAGRELLQVQMDHADYIIEQDDQLDRIYFTEKELQNNDYINNDGVHNINFEENYDQSIKGDINFEENYDQSIKGDLNFTENYHDQSIKGDINFRENYPDQSIKGDINFRENYQNQSNVNENYHQEDSPDAEAYRPMDPSGYGVTDAMIEAGGWVKIDEATWAVIRKDATRIPVPDPENEMKPEEFIWRSTWLRKDGRWNQLEDEIPWNSLRQKDRLVTQNQFLVSVFKKNINVHGGRSMRHFPGMQRASLQKLVRRAHEGMGHPDRERFIRILRSGRAPEEVINIAKELKCSVCEAYRLPAPPHRASPPREEFGVNDLVGIDTVHIRNHKNENVPAANIIDWNTHFQLVIPMKAENASCIRSAYRQWTRFFGPPRRVMVDLGTEFLAEFRREAEIDGAEVIPSPVEAPNQRGLTERAGGLFKNMLYRAMQDFACSNEPEWRELVDTTCLMRNRLMMRSGYSPIQRVIGYSPRLPAGLHSDGEQDYMAADLIHIGDRDARRAMEMRKAAAIAFHQTDCQRALRLSYYVGSSTVREL